MKKVIKGTNLETMGTDTLMLDPVIVPESYDVPTTAAVAAGITEAVGRASDALQEQINEIAEKAGSGYTPKGQASVATLNGLSAQENGWLYVLTDAGTLTDGSLAVVAGDTVAWDATNSVWYKTYDNAKLSSLKESVKKGVEIKPYSSTPSKRFRINDNVIEYFDASASICSVVYDVSSYEIVTLNTYCNIDQNIETAVLTDNLGNVVNVVLTAEQVGTRYISDARNMQVFTVGATRLHVMYTNVTNGNGVNYLTSGTIERNEKRWKKLSGTFKNGSLYNNGSFSTNWRCCTDEYDVSGIGHVVIDQCYDAQVYSLVFKDSNDTDVNFFGSTASRYGDRKMMVPVPPSAVKMIIVSTISRDKDDNPIPYHRTSVYSIDSIESPYNFTLEEILAKEHNSFDILFIGNSLTQDAVSYLPFLLEKNFPDVEFNIYMWYCAGYTLKQQWENKIDPNVNVGCDMFSVAHSNEKWATQGSIKMSAIMNYINADHVCLQEYFNYVESYTAADCEYFNKIVDYLSSLCKRPFEVECLFHAPKRGEDFESIYTLTKDGNIIILKNTAATDIFVPGCAIYEACKTSLDSLGDLGHLSPDNTHAQEGLPCQLEAFVMLAQVLDKIGKPASIEGISSVVDSSNYSDINIPGPNLGNGVVEGTTADWDIARRVASYSVNKRNALLSETF